MTIRRKALAPGPALIRDTRLREDLRTPGAVEAAVRGITPALEILDAHLAGSAYVAGDRFSMGDIPAGGGSAPVAGVRAGGSGCAACRCVARAARRAGGFPAPRPAAGAARVMIVTMRAALERLWSHAHCEPRALDHSADYPAAFGAMAGLARRAAEGGSRFVGPSEFTASATPRVGCRGRMAPRRPGSGTRAPSPKREHVG